MIFSKLKYITDISLHIATLTGQSIEKISEYKYLGIWLDQKLTFKFHINTLVSKLRQKSIFLDRNRTFPVFCSKQIIDTVCPGFW